MPPRNRQRPAAASMLTPRPEALVQEPAAASPSGPPLSIAGQSVRSVESDAGTVYLSARVPRTLRDAVQHQAIREGRPAAQLVQEALRAYLESHAPS